MSKHPLQRLVLGDASETAILQFNEIVIGKVEEYRAKNRRVCEIPFNSANKYQVSIHETDDGDQRHLLVVKRVFFSLDYHSISVDERRTGTNSRAMCEDFY